ncbi:MULTISPECIES: hypothetical protein [Halorussus]|uniref:hypothetical protein n=1 Tax=Halorussus TaxID=1070314 RepID=UPI000E217CAB|nr:MULTISPECIES: hypothetical protein [Halorussus]NHN57954.1 hypothetical protein [Halorussus sp. JP-T4]
MAPALLSPKRRDALLAVVALALLAGPIWAPLAHFGDPTYRYESARVTASDGTIAYANDSDPPVRGPISADVACTGDFAHSRGCYFERYLARNHTVPTGIASSTPGPSRLPTVDHYEYAIVNGTTYETSYVANRSAENSDGMYRVDLALEPASAGDALQRVSVSAEDVRPAVREAARTGVGTAHREVDVPETPVRLGDNTYYRVYAAGHTDRLNVELLLADILRWGSPLVGLALAGRLRSRVDVRYVGDGRSE